MNMGNNPLWRFTGLNWIIGFFFVFLYFPIIVLVALSFNANSVATLWTGFTFDWYRVVIENPNIVRAAQNSIIVALSATVLSTLLALAAAVGMAGRDFRGQHLVNGLIGLPLLVPEIVTAVASLLFFLSIGLELGLHTVIIAHIVFCTPFAYLPIRARLEGLDGRLLEAAQDLYATPLKAFWRVTLPLLMPGILSGAMLAFIISLDDFVITFFVAGAGATTLPVYIFGMIRVGITPEVNAVSTLLLLVSIIVVALSAIVANAGKTSAVSD
jgi:spermidine/putrescine transport system permease protein